MSNFSINRVVLVGRLTRDPELRALPSGSSVCSLRIACNSARKDADGDFVERPNYFDVSVFGASAESVSQYMRRGSRVAIDGRLEWREWETAEQERRQAVSIIADTVQFLDSPGERSRGDAPGDGGEAGSAGDGDRELVGVGVGAEEDDLVF
ncbi:MAG TPA: single-stranded DNA-binding protein [Solirubrobacteraceae bacterium]|nr:single-stranded DNA-binding protein [Solirubrobacteraceae bacterium]HLM87382.1 single-stranded DNA-binding protein [Solirubrobacteraceae bacterium]